MGSAIETSSDRPLALLTRGIPQVHRELVLGVETEVAQHFKPDGSLVVHAHGLKSMH